MRFLLRCILCLGVLYAVILRHDGYLVDPGHLAEAAWTLPQQARAHVIESASPHIAARVEAYCRQEPATCLAKAAALAGPLGTAQAATPHKPRVTLGARTP